MLVEKRKICINNYCPKNYLVRNILVPTLVGISKFSASLIICITLELNKQIKILQHIKFTAAFNKLTNILEPVY